MSKDETSGTALTKGERSELAPVSAQPRRRSLLELSAEAASRPLARLDIREDEEAIVLFTPEFEEVEVHFLDEPEMHDYVTCNGSGCPLCVIGRKSYKRFLLPIYACTHKAVMVLPIGDSRRPHSLLPQIQELLLRQAGGDALLALVRRENKTRYILTTRTLPEDVDAGEGAIAAFVRAYEAGEVSLSSVYQSLTNAELARIPGVEAQMRLRGYRPNQDEDPIQGVGCTPSTN